MEIDPILKVVDKGCNLDCSYCFYNKQSREKKIMDLKILEKVVYEICNYNSGNINFIWHGGEPLLAGIELYEKALEFQERFRKSNQKITNNIQTNGTLLDKEWASFFKKHRFNIGISLDGPKEIHDKHRRFSDGRGSFKKVIQGIEILKKTGVEFSIISVITKEKMGISRAIFNFLVSQQPTWINLGASLGILTGDGISLEYSIRPALYIDFLIEIFDLWLERKEYKIKILPIDTIICGFLGKPHRDYRLVGECKKNLFNRKCERNLVIISNGDITTCGFHGYGDLFKFGNIEEGLEKVLSSGAYQEYKEHLRRIKEKCAKCKWYRVCHNGCPRDYYLGGDHGIFCEDFPRLFQHIHESLKKYLIYRE